MVIKVTTFSLKCKLLCCREIFGRSNALTSETLQVSVNEPAGCFQILLTVSIGPQGFLRKGEAFLALSLISILVRVSGSTRHLHGFLKLAQFRYKAFLAQSQHRLSANFITFICGIPRIRLCIDHAEGPSVHIKKKHVCKFRHHFLYYHQNQAMHRSF